MGVFVANVEFEVHFGDGELAHGVYGTQVGAGGEHFFEKVVGYGGVGLVVPGEEVEALAFPAPVFEDLGGELNEVPGDLNAVEGFDFDIAEDVVEEVAEFVEDGFDFVVSEEGGLILGGAGEVAADEAEVGFVLGTGEEVVHPGASAFGFSGMPVGIEGAEEGAIFFVNLVVLNVVVPSFDVF